MKDTVVAKFERIGTQVRVVLLNIGSRLFGVESKACGANFGLVAYVNDMTHNVIEFMLPA